MNSLILLPLIIAAAVAAPLSQDTPANTYLMNNYPVVYGNPVGYPYLGLNDRNGLFRQNIPGFTVLIQQAASALSNLQLYYTVQKWNTVLCLLDSTCPQVVLPPTNPLGR